MTFGPAPATLPQPCRTRTTFNQLFLQLAAGAGGWVAVWSALLKRKVCYAFDTFRKYLSTSKMAQRSRGVHILNLRPSLPASQTPSAIASSCPIAIAPTAAALLLLLLSSSWPWLLRASAYFALVHGFN